MRVNKANLKFFGRPPFSKRARQDNSASLRKKKKGNLGQRRVTDEW
jgi:hypothetical protein